MLATTAVWKVARRVARLVRTELREPGTYRPCPVDLSPGSPWYYVDRATTATLPFVCGSLVVVALGPLALALDFWAGDQLRELFRDYVLPIDQPRQLLHPLSE